MIIDPPKLPALALGCAVLGSGGGSDPYTDLLILRQAVDRHGPISLIDVENLSDDAFVLACSSIGASAVASERVMGADAGHRLIDAVAAARGTQVTCVVPTGIGSSGGLIPLAWALSCGLPVLDADCMGRSFPSMPQTLPNLAGISPDPLVISDERGPVVIARDVDADAAERLALGVAQALGGAISCADFGLTRHQVPAATVSGSISRALRVGEAILAEERTPCNALASALAGTVLARAKVAEVGRHTQHDRSRGWVHLEGVGDDEGRLLRLEIQNDYLVALEDGRVLATVPDLISVVDERTANPIATEALGYGQRVAVITSPCAAEAWITQSGLELVGPRAFGYDLDYVATGSIS